MIFSQHLMFLMVWLWLHERMEPVAILMIQLFKIEIVFVLLPISEITRSESR